MWDFVTSNLVKISLNESYLRQLNRVSDFFGFVYIIVWEFVTSNLVNPYHVQIYTFECFQLWLQLMIQSFYLLSKHIRPCDSRFPLTLIIINDLIFLSSYLLCNMKIPFLLKCLCATKCCWRSDILRTTSLLLEFHFAGTASWRWCQWCTPCKSVQCCNWEDWAVIHGMAYVIICFFSLYAIFGIFNQQGNCKHNTWATLSILCYALKCYKLIPWTLQGKNSSDEEDLNDVPDDDEYDTEDSFIDDAELVSIHNLFCAVCSTWNCVASAIIDEENGQWPQPSSTNCTFLKSKYY